MEESKYKNLIFVMKALALFFIVVFFNYDPFFPYAFEIGPWLLSQHIVMYVSLCLAAILYFGSYRIEHYRNLHLTSRLAKPNTEQRSKQMKFITVGIFVTCILLGLSGYYVVSEIKKANLKADPISEALIVEKELIDKNCKLIGHHIKYNGELQPVIVRKSVHSDDVKYINDDVSVSIPPLDRDERQVKVEYKCDGKTQIFSEFRFRKLMEK